MPSDPSWYILSAHELINPCGTIPQSTNGFSTSSYKTSSKPDTTEPTANNLHPNGMRRYIDPYTVCHTCISFGQLLFRPQVTRPEEVLGTFQGSILSNRRVVTFWWIHSFLRILMHVIGSGFDLTEFRVTEKCRVRRHPHGNGTIWWFRWKSRNGFPFFTVRDIPSTHRRGINIQLLRRTFSTALISLRVNTHSADAQQDTTDIRMFHSLVVYSLVEKRSPF